MIFPASVSTASKTLPPERGSCIVTEDPEILSRVRDARLLAVEKDAERRFSGQRSWEFDVLHQGWRYHMSNIMAAIGLAQLQRFLELAAQRQRLAQRYDLRMSGDTRITLLQHDYALVVPHIYVVQLPAMQDRKRLQNDLLNLGIQTGVHYQPNHGLSLYAEKLTVEHGILREAERIAGHILTLPLHSDLTEQDVDYICDQLLALLNE